MTDWNLGRLKSLLERLAGLLADGFAEVNLSTLETLDRVSVDRLVRNVEHDVRTIKSLLKRERSNRD